MKKFVKALSMILILVMMIGMLGTTVFAAQEAADEAEAIVAVEENAEAKVLSSKAIAAAAVIGIVAATGAVSMAWSITKSVDSISRQPEAAGNIRTSLMLGLVFIETAIIYALIVAILIVFVL